MLDDFIEANGLTAEIIRFEKEVKTTKGAAAAIKAELSDIVKSILLFDVEKNSAVLAVLPGDCRVDLEKVIKLTGFSSLKLATPEQAVEVTGYEAGSVPPVSIYGVKTLVDRKVLEKEVVYAGGGDDFSVLKISPKEIVEHGFEVQIEDIASD